MQTSDLNVNNTESDHANAIFRQFQDAIFSREHTYVKTLTKIIFDLLQWQEIATLSLPKKAAIAPFISTTFPGHFCLRANDIARNRSRVIFYRACVDIFRWWNRPPSCSPRSYVKAMQLKARDTAFTSASKHEPVIFSFLSHDPCSYTSVHTTRVSGKL